MQNYILFCSTVRYTGTFRLRRKFFELNTNTCTRVQILRENKIEKMRPCSKMFFRKLAFPRVIFLTKLLLHTGPYYAPPRRDSRFGSIKAKNTKLWGKFPPNYAKPVLASAPKFCHLTFSTWSYEFFTLALYVCSVLDLFKLLWQLRLFLISLRLLMVSLWLS